MTGDNGMQITGCVYLRLDKSKIKHYDIPIYRKAMKKRSTHIGSRQRGQPTG